jgi:hypothetical protein
VTSVRSAARKQPFRTFRRDHEGSAEGVVSAIDLVGLT